MITANIIGEETSNQGNQTFQAINPVTKESLPGEFVAATEEEVNLAVQKAVQASHVYRHKSGVQKAAFLRAIATGIEELGDELVQRDMLESGLPEGRVKGERGRTCGQLRLFADLVEEGSWVQATLNFDTNTPPTGPHLGNFLTALGPVVVFTASNFPLAFSTAGGDTASALAAGCPVIVKAHESHPGVNAMIAEVIQTAAKETGMPDGVFSSLNAADYSVGTRLVQHESIKAVAFTGSTGGGMALHKLAMEREHPIPVFAEMGSINPIFLLPETVSKNTEKLATDIAGSVNLGAGQFCTNPGLIITQKNQDYDHLTTELKRAFKELVPATMLNQGIYKNFEKGKLHFISTDDIQTEFKHDGNGEWKGYPALASVSAKKFIANPALQEEVFGPFSLIIECEDESEMNAVAGSLQGQLSAVIMGTDADLASAEYLKNILLVRVGRLAYNSMPTGVAVNHAMQHGGPFPATTDARFTSVGTGAIKRFVRPIVFQNAPENLLPPELQKDNPLGIWRLVNGDWTKS